ncbi:hypothetical protein [Streptomyces sp. NPDC029004]|uniref:hypothetical protein n=1 Tax=Streptomyces sp. NPDC029004 TaxID=3154490 RepID=UPI0033F10D0F
MDTYAHGYGSTGHYAKPGTHTSYCGRELQHTPNTGNAQRVCKACTKAEKVDRVAAEQVAADRAIEGPTLAERAGVRYATVGTGRRVHYSNNDDTLCGREVSEYVDGADLLAVLSKGHQLCARCGKAAEQRAYALSLAAASPLAAAAVELAETAEQADADREQQAPAVHRFYSTSEAYNATQCRDDIRDGDVLIIEREQVVGFLRRAWPGAITKAHGEMHTFTADPRTIDDGRYALTVQYAEQIARDLEYPLAEQQPAAVETVEAEQFATAARAADVVEYAKHVEAAARDADWARALEASARAALDPTRPARPRPEGGPRPAPTGAPEMNNEPPPRTSARPTGPTLDGFRKHLLDEAEQAPLIPAGILRAVVRLVDDYTADLPGTSVPGRDTLSRRNLHNVASVYRSTQNHDRGDLDGLLDDYANEFSLADIRILRVAAEAVAAATPRAIKAARARGMKPPQIADELGLTPSRVYQVLRELDAEQGKQPAADGDQ